MDPNNKRQRGSTSPPPPPPPLVPGHPELNPYGNWPPQFMTPMPNNVEQYPQQYQYPYGYNMPPRGQMPQMQMPPQMYHDGYIRSQGSSHIPTTIPPNPHTSSATVEHPISENPDIIWMTEAEMEKYRNATNRSIWWKHFIRTSSTPRMAKCIYCNELVGGDSRNGTNTLKRHYESCKSVTETNQPTIDQFMTKGKGKKTPKPYDVEVCRNQLSRMIITTENSFRHSEHPEFNKYCELLLPEHQKTSRKMVRSNGLRQYCEMKEKIKKELRDHPGRVCLTSDAWDSGSNGLHYMVLTCHWIDDAWILQKRIITFALLEFPHNAENLHNVMLKGIDEYDLRGKILCVTFDNASAMTALAERLKRSLTNLVNDSLLHVRCSCHILNRCVQDGLDGIKETITFFRYIAKAITTNHSLRQEWHYFCNAHGVKYRGFAPDMTIRWNSTYTMLNALISHKETLTMWWNSKFPTNAIQHAYWDQAIMYADFLKVFEDATNAFSHAYIPTANNLIQNLDPIAELFHLNRDKPECKKFLPAMEKKFLKYYKVIPFVYVISSILDPRCKLQDTISIIGIYFGHMNITPNSATYGQRITDTFHEVFYFYQDKHGGTRPDINPLEPEPSQKKGWLSKMRSQIRGKASGSSTQLGGGRQQDLTEFDNYLNYKHFVNYSYDQEANLDILAWWNENQGNYPVLASMARDFLAVQASSVTSERAFSSSKRQLVPLRSSMNGKTLQMVVCLKDWIEAEERTQGMMDLSSEDGSAYATSTESLFEEAGQSSHSQQQYHN